MPRIRSPLRTYITPGRYCGHGQETGTPKPRTWTTRSRRQSRPAGHQRGHRDREGCLGQPESDQERQCRPGLAGHRPPVLALRPCPPVPWPQAATGAARTPSSSGKWHIVDSGWLEGRLKRAEKPAKPEATAGVRAMASCKTSPFASSDEKASGGVPRRRSPSSIASEGDWSVGRLTSQTLTATGRLHFVENSHKLFIHISFDADRTISQSPL
jgi:hypothetical protein